MQYVKEEAETAIELVLVCSNAASERCFQICSLGDGTTSDDHSHFV